MSLRIDVAAAVGKTGVCYTAASISNGIRSTWHHRLTLTVNHAGACYWHLHRWSNNMVGVCVGSRMAATVPISIGISHIITTADNLFIGHFHITGVRRYLLTACVGHGNWHLVGKVVRSTNITITVDRRIGRSRRNDDNIIFNLDFYLTRCGAGTYTVRV